MRIQGGYREDTVVYIRGIVGVQWDTVRAQSGYSRDTIRRRSRKEEEEE